MYPQRTSWHCRLDRTTCPLLANSLVAIVPLAQPLMSKLRARAPTRSPAEKSPTCLLGGPGSLFVALLIREAFNRGLTSPDEFLTRDARSCHARSRPRRYLDRPLCRCDLTEVDSRITLSHLGNLRPWETPCNAVQATMPPVGRPLLAAPESRGSDGVIKSLSVRADRLKSLLRPYSWLKPVALRKGST
jgi:hypothetical protein